MRAFAAALMITVTLATAAQAAPVTVTIDAKATGPVIARDVFGQFAEHLGRGVYEGVWVGPDSPIPNTRGIRNDVVGALKALKVPNVRWPGGCFADTYHWRKGVGPTRQPTLNFSWGGVIEPNTFGTHEFMDFADQIGADAYVSVNVGSGTVEEMTDWMDYMTSDRPTALAKERAANGHAAPYKVRLLGIGNENWGCGGAMTADQYVQELRKYATFAKNYDSGQKGMVRVAAGPSDDDKVWTETVMKAWSSRNYAWDFEALSLHAYAGFAKWPPNMAATGFDEADYALVLKSALRMESYVADHAAIMDRYDPEKKVGLYVDEWGAWYAVEKGTNPGFLYQQNSQRDALLAALTLNIFARHADRVRGANVAQMVNVLQAMILTDGGKMLLTPTYHLFRMYLPFQGATTVPVKLDAGTYQEGDTALPRLDAIAARGADGAVWLSISNLDPRQAAEVELPAKTATGQTLAAPRFNSINTFDAPNTVAPKSVSAKAKGGKLVLPLAPASVTVVRLD